MEQPPRLRPMTAPSPGGSAPSRLPYARPVEVRNGAGLAALVLGLLALLLAVMPAVGLLLSAAAVTLGIRGVRRVRRFEATNRRQAQLGLIAGSVAAVLAVATTLALIVFWPQVRQYRDCVADSTNESERTACQEQFRSAIDERLR